MESITTSDVVLDVETSLKTMELSIKDPELCSLLADKEEDERKRFVECASGVGIVALQGMEIKMRVKNKKMSKPIRTSHYEKISRGEL